MSYILDALKKSEQERKLGGLPDISSEHQVLHKAHGQSWLRYVLTFLLAIFISALIFFAYSYVSKNKAIDSNIHANTQISNNQNQSKKTNTNVTKHPDSETANAESEISTESLPEIIKPSKERRDDLQKKQTLEQQKSEKIKREYQEYFKDENSQNTVVAEEQEEDVLEEEVEESDIEPSWDDYDSIASLSDDIKRQLPHIKVTTHIYSSVESFRKVTINGYSVNKGSEISEGLIVENIVEEGVIFSFKGVYFRMKALEVWEG